MSSDERETMKAFDAEAISAGNFALGIDHEKLNINGGSISIGHPFGMTGSRMVGTLANQMIEKQAQWGVFKSEWFSASFNRERRVSGYTVFVSNGAGE